MNHISKKISFIALAGLLLSNVPVQAMASESYATLSGKDRSERADDRFKSIKKGWKNFRACLLGKKECSRAKVATLRLALLGLLALATYAGLTQTESGKHVRGYVAGTKLGKGAARGYEKRRSWFGRKAPAEIQVTTKDLPPVEEK